MMRTKIEDRLTTSQVKAGAMANGTGIRGRAVQSTSLSSKKASTAWFLAQTQVKGFIQWKGQPASRR